MTYLRPDLIVQQMVEAGARNDRMSDSGGGTWI